MSRAGKRVSERAAAPDLAAAGQLLTLLHDDMESTLPGVAFQVHSTALELQVPSEAMQPASLGVVEMQAALQLHGWAVVQNLVAAVHQVLHAKLRALAEVRQSQRTSAVTLESICCATSLLLQFEQSAHYCRSNAACLLTPHPQLSALAFCCRTMLNSIANQCLPSRSSTCRCSSCPLR